MFMGPDLSPDGRWLAGPIRTNFVSLWGTDGQAAGRFSPATANATEQDLKTTNPDQIVERSYAWIGFTDATHLAMLTDDQKLWPRPETNLCASSCWGMGLRTS